MKLSKSILLYSVHTNLLFSTKKVCLFSQTKKVINKKIECRIYDHVDKKNNYFFSNCSINPRRIQEKPYKQYVFTHTSR